jgi:SAM-dependent methyltransferase
MLHLPFRNGTFDKTVSVTALEFIGDAQTAVSELFRVTRPGGTVVVATLNSLSPWAERRREKTEKGRKHVLENAHYRSPDDLLNLCPFIGVAKTAVHFRRDDEPEEAVRIEIIGSETDPDSGAFVAVMWQKPVSG